MRCVPLALSRAGSQQVKDASRKQHAWCSRELRSARGVSEAEAEWVLVGAGHAAAKVFTFRVHRRRCRSTCDSSGSTASTARAYVLFPVRTHARAAREGTESYHGAGGPFPQESSQRSRCLHRLLRRPSRCGLIEDDRRGFRDENARVCSARTFSAHARGRGRGKDAILGRKRAKRRVFGAAIAVNQSCFVIA